MASPNGFDLSQLDMNDPETRSYVQNNVDMSDKATKDWFDSTTSAYENKNGVPLLSSQGPGTIAPVATNQQPSLSNSFNESIEKQGGWGLAPDTRQVLNATGIPGLGEGADLAFRGYQGLMGGAEAGASGLDRLARATGLNQSLSMGGNEFLPGTALMSLMEAFPAGGVEAGIAPHPVGKAPEAPSRVPEPVIDAAAQQERMASHKAMNSEITNALQNPNVTVNDINDIATKYGVDPSTLGNVEDTVNYVRQGGKGASAASKPGVVGIKTESPAMVTKADVDQHIENVSKNWKNAPEFESVQSINDIADPEIRSSVPDDALGFVGPDGKVRIIADNLNGPEDLSAVTFHEALGHHGLTAQFQDNLDNVLDRMYDYGRNTDFRNRVDNFMERNPDAYADDFNPRARAAEEVLAQMSENGEMPKSQMNVIRHQLRDFGRKAGFDVNFDDKEVSAILGMAHDATINGRMSPAANGFRYSLGNTNRMSDEDARAFMEYSQGRNVRPSELYRQMEEGSNPEAYNDITTRADQLRNIEAARERSASSRFSRPSQFEETRRDDQGNIFLNYKNGSENIPIKMAIEKDGTAEIAIDQFSTKANRLGPARIREAMMDLADKYPEIERFGGYRRSGAGKGRVQELSVPERKIVDSANRYMRRSYGESEGQLQGRVTREGEDERAAIGSFRSNRNIDQIMQEAQPEKISQTFQEWIDKAGETKMTGKIAQSLATGVEPPELLAAKEFAVRSANRIHDLSRKIGDGVATPNDHYILNKEVERLDNTIEAIQKVTTNASHILNASKITVESDKKLMDTIRNMTASNPQLLNTAAGRQQFAQRLVKTTANAKRMDSILSALGEAINLPRTLMATADLSAPFRQGWFLMGRKEFWKAYPEMFKMAFREGGYQDLMKDIQNRPTYGAMKKSGLHISDIDGHIGQREEQFLSKWGEKIPVAGQVHRGSERAYTGFLNKVRADTFDSLVNKYKDMGIDVTKDKETLNAISRYVNNATGRGALPGSWDKAAPALAGLFFSPRLMAARLNMLNPVEYARMPAPIRAEAMKSLLGAGAITMTVLGLAASAGADVETNPMSSDFAKIKVGNTRYDVLGGFGQYLTLGARLLTNKTKNIRGETNELGKGFGSQTRKDVLEKFFENKASPVASFVLDYLNGKNAVGEPFTLGSEVGNRLVPLYLQDAYDQISKYGVGAGVARSAPSIFGIGLQDYSGKEYSSFNRVFPQSDSSSPVAKEFDRLNNVANKAMISPATNKISADGMKINLTDEEQKKFNSMIGDEMTKELAPMIATDQWKALPDKDKIEIIKDVHKEARDTAKETFLSSGLSRETMQNALKTLEEENTQ